MVVLGSAIGLSTLAAAAAPEVRAPSASPCPAEGLSRRFVENARITLETACLAKRGESVLIVTDRTPEWVACTRALEAAAVELGLVPVVMDISAYSDIVTDKAQRKAVLGKSTAVKPIKSALEAADLVVRMPTLRASYWRLLDDPDASDRALTAEERRMVLQTTNMDRWQITAEEVALIRRRTTWLADRLRTVKRIHVTSSAGTDFSAGVGPGAKWYPILGIVPLYGEVAVVPQMGPDTQGVFAVDGPSYYDVRPIAETERTPLRITVKNGRFVDVSGDAEQVARLRKLVDRIGPANVVVDEVGLVTTSIAANDAYWTCGRFTNGTHSHNTIHIALGSNVARDKIVHGRFHMDCDLRRPTVRLDGLVILRDGKFVDSLLDR
jgi:leucyl aminopeptidase (aminopeptidase T)